MLKVENITYKTRQTEILKGVSLQVKQGEFVGVIGPNGSGKSTLLKNIYRMLTPTSGEILLDGKSLIIGMLDCFFRCSIVFYRPEHAAIFLIPAMIL